MKFTAIILAGGRGTRLQSLTRDKTLLRIGAGAVISWSVHAFARCEACESIVLTYRDNSQREKIESELQRSVPKLPPLHWVVGGDRRQDSVLNALSSVPHCSEWVFIHDGARPFITDADLDALMNAAQTTGAAALAVPLTDTVKRADRTGTLEGLLLEDLQRERLFAMQTPQVFRSDVIRSAYTQLQQTGATVTDCVDALMRANPTPVTLVNPEQNNLKITRPEDVELANFLVHTGSIKKVFELAYH